MLNNILDLKGVTTLNKKEQQTIKAGTYYGDQCLSLCSGRCSFGRCFEQID
ncbi:hypothetical protein [Aquimarina sp. 2201CG5-10]|uniref:hypothetical protein n=1 Tax=Aquimarina callyspongiae TaxID=3098150 RepID=UPI002AB37D8C|nr:hypothetical protein [Aquimarina sp. 2201CG5-10]MDY8137395.1 hypothetical protein [Aquimarina sp. 2201CG5-10]